MHLSDSWHKSLPPISAKSESSVKEALLVNCSYWLEIEINLKSIQPIYMRKSKQTPGSDYLEEALCSYHLRSLLDFHKVLDSHPDSK